MKMKWELMPFQKKGVRKMQRFNGRVLQADEMGLGKTIQFLFFMKKNKKAWPVVIICPASLKFMWQRRTEEVLGIYANVLEGRTPPKQTPSFTGKKEMVIINYDILKGWESWLQDFNPSTIVMDECQAVKNPGTIRSQVCRGLCHGARNAIGLSGTPMLNDPSELWSPLNMIRPDVYRTKKPFVDQFCKVRWTPWGPKVTGGKNLQTLNEELHDVCMVRRLKIDVYKDLPKMNRSVVPIPLSNASDYEDARVDFKGWLKKKKPSHWKKAGKAEALMKMGYLKRLAAQYKLPSAVEWLDNWLDCNPKEKIVVFGVHRNMIKALCQRYPESTHIHGGVSARKRRIAIDQFQNDPETRLFFGNIQAAGAGVDGLQVASSLAFFELDWVPGRHLQAEARVHRIGQKRPTWIYYLVANRTIEDDLCELLQRKHQDIVNSLNGDGDVTFSIYETLLRNHLN